MGRKTMSSGAAEKTPKSPAPRRQDFEQALCRAISSLKLVTLSYGDDSGTRIFAPHAVYRSTTSKILVSGVQLTNTSDAINQQEPKNLEVGRITSLRITDDTFNPDRRFNPHDSRYQNGIICRV